MAELRCLQPPPLKNTIRTAQFMEGSELERLELGWRDKLLDGKRMAFWLALKWMDEVSSLLL